VFLSERPAPSVGIHSQARRISRPRPHDNIRAVRPFILLPPHFPFDKKAVNLV